MNQKGFSMLELLLASALVSLIAIAVAPMMLRVNDDVSAKATADDYSLFQAAAAAHFQANRATYISAMTDGTGAANLCKLGVAVDGTGGVSANNTTLKTCALDGSMLRFLQALPTQVRERNRYGERWVAIFRAVYTTAPPIQPTGGVEMLVVSADVDGVGGVVNPDPRRYGEAAAAAEFTGGSGGVVPDTDRSTCVVNKNTNRFEACGNGWKVNLSDFVSPTQLAAFANRVQN